MTKEELDFIGSMNMCDEISNEAYKKIVCHCREQQLCEDCISRAKAIEEADKLCLETGYDNEKVIEMLNDLPSVTPKSKSEYEHDHEVVKAYNDGQAYILDKIRAEVEILGKDYLGCPQPQVVCDDVIKIIDKYRGE